MKRTSVLGALAAAATTLVLVAGCGDGATPSSGTPSSAASSSSVPSTPTAATAHNAADTMFVQGMIPHHQQAVAMAELAASRAGDPRVTDLAGRIQQAQGPEIEQMRGLLTAWGEPESGAMSGSGSMPGMDHGSMGGMMTDQQMQQLQQASGAEFDRMFLQMMVEHHQGAVTMSQAELTGGENPDAKALAQKIIDAQQAEIAEMQALLPSV